MYLPLLSGGANEVDTSAGTLVQITSVEQLEEVLWESGVSQEEIRALLEIYRAGTSQVGSASTDSPTGYSFRPLACFGQGATALFDVGQGFFTANYFVPGPTGISGYCNDTLCTYNHSRGPATAGIYGHSVSSDGFASHIYAQCTS